MISRVEKCDVLGWTLLVKYVYIILLLGEVERIGFMAITRAVHVYHT